jgi:hypothetical protein
MAIATSAAIIGGISAAGGIAKSISGAKRAKAVKMAQARFRRQELSNVNEGRRISTRGAELANEQNARGLATSTEALRSGGVRGVVGGSQGLQEASNNNANQIGAGLDQQQVQLDREFAQDEVRIQGMQEQRDNAELGAMQAQANAAQQDIWSGVGDVAGAAGAMAGGLKSGQAGAKPFDFGIDPNKSWAMPDYSKIPNKPF